MTQKRILFIDHFDSFSENIVAFFRAASFDVVPMQTNELPFNDVPQFTRAFSAIVFSPGPKHPKDYPQSLAFYSALPPNLPVLGICLGHQLMLYADDARVEQIHTNPVHGRRQSLVFPTTRLLKSGPFEGTAIFYNSLGVHIDDPVFRNNLWSCVKAVDNQCVVAEHAFLPRIGLQFHPESFASTIGTKLLSAFTRVCSDFGR